jgi:hypothetical protein
MGQQKSNSTPVWPFTKASSHAIVLHQDKPVRRDIHKFFGVPLPPHDPARYWNQNDLAPISQHPDPPSYNPADNDLAVFKAASGAEREVKDKDKEDEMEDRAKSAKDQARDSLLDCLRYKLSNESP